MPDHAGSYAYPIAVIMQDNDPQEVEMALWHAITILRTRGLDIGGFVQKRGRLRSDGRHEMYVHDLTDGSLIRLDRYRGAGARACTLDMDAMGALAVTLRARIEQNPDVLFVNRFGVREAEGGGLRTEIAEAICRGIPIVVVVSRNHLPAWEAFIGQAHAAPVLPPESASLLDWAHLYVRNPAERMPVERYAE
ncbi:hypothetical protein JCM25156A_07710 [Komagataeibacter kakiaceti JCM 25156]